MIAQATLEDYLGISAGVDTAIITGLEAAAVRFMQQETRRYFGATDTVTEYHYGETEEWDGISVEGHRRHTPYIYLREKALATIASVSYTSTPGGTTTTVTASDSDGYVQRDGTADPRDATVLIRKGGYGWFRGYEYTVTYSRGWGTDTGNAWAAPPDILEAVKRLVQIGYGKVKDGTAGPLQSENIGDYSYSLADVKKVDSGVMVLDTVQHWRRLVV